MKIDLSPDGTAAPEPEPGDNMTKQELSSAIREYAETVDLEVDLCPTRVRVEISSKMKRAAGKAIFKKGERRGPPFILRFAGRAYSKWGWDDRFKGVIRHELVHLWEYQQFGTSDHGARFKRKCREVDAPLKCEKFAAHNWEVFCGGCGRVVAERLKRSKVVKHPETYRSKCCKAPCESRRA